MPRYFTLLDAERLLPDVERVIRQAIDLKAEMVATEQELHAASRRIAMSGGAMVNHERLLMQKARREASATQLKEAIDRIQEYGCLVKDLDIGLLDFPTLYRGEEVYLCWKLGENGIQYWHGIHEGFRGRKKIDREFLDNHAGEP
jgi:hypothetical protein